MLTKRNLVISIVVCVLIVAIGIFYIKNNTSNSSNQNVLDQTQATPTITRHDNSGAGASTDENPIQDHFQHAMQHLGL